MKTIVMNAKCCAVILATAALSLSGCKTTESAAMAKPSADLAAEKPGTTYAPRIVENTDYVSHVENLALRRGVYVRWVNKPQKRVVDKTDR
jgi:hypothetical protein